MFVLIELAVHWRWRGSPTSTVDFLCLATSILGIRSSFTPCGQSALSKGTRLSHNGSEADECQHPFHRIFSQTLFRSKLSLSLSHSTTMNNNKNIFRRRRNSRMGCWTCFEVFAVYVVVVENLFWFAASCLPRSVDHQKNVSHVLVSKFQVNLYL